MSAVSEIEVSQPNGVSPLRRKISAIVLVILAVILTVEIRAGVGHMLTGKALQEKGPDGAFVDTTYAEVQNLLTLAPAQSTIRESESEIEYKYHWFSLLRPVFQRPDAAYYLTVNRASPARALRYSMEPPTAEELQKRNSEATTDPIDDMSMTAGGPGGGGGAGFGGPGGGAGFGGSGGPDRPVQDPLVSALDKDNDGELSEEELNNAATELLTADTNGDGVLTGDELRPAQASGSPVRRRPPMEDEEEATPDPQSTEGGDEDPNSEAVKTDDAKTDDTSEAANSDDKNN